MNTWGNSIRVTIFGESHGPAIGCVIDGISKGLAIDEEFIAGELARRAPGRDEYATARQEADVPSILSGVKDGISTGAPIACIIENTNQRSGDYDSVLRPSHADWTSLLKYGAHADMAGGGRFSGRLTAPLVFAGAICKLALRSKGINIYGRICAIGGERDSIDLAGKAANAKIDETEKLLSAIAAKPFPASDNTEQKFKDAILAAKNDDDSVGGGIEVAVFGNTAGLGEPFFGSIESTLSSLYFSVPAVKGVEWGAGIDIANLRGSEANDPLALTPGSVDTPVSAPTDTLTQTSASITTAKRIVSTTNNNGGVLGGIANGMPIFARIWIKPTASIAKEQNMISLDGGLSEVRTALRGRHDPCIVPRAVPVIEAVTAIGLLDLCL
jgi:chorismate synthase